MENISNTLPLGLILVTVVMCLESNNWWTFWIILEFNTLGFLINLLVEKNNENTFTFFLFQSISSISLITYIFFSNWYMEQSQTSQITFILIIAMFMNIGIFPFQNWVVNVSQSFCWSNLFLMLTWMNIIPILIFINISSNVNILIVLVLCLSAITIMLINTSNSNTIIVMSSLAHNSWIFMPINIFNATTILYFSMYSTVVLPIIVLLNKSFSLFIYFQSSNNAINNENIILILSLAGTPPTMGFIANIIVLLTMLNIDMLNWSIALIFSSTCISFFVYFQIFSNNMNNMENCSTSSVEPNNTPNNFFLWTLIIIPITIS